MSLRAPSHNVRLVYLLVVLVVVAVSLVSRTETTLWVPQKLPDAAMIMPLEHGFNRSTALLSHLGPQESKPVREWVPAPVVVAATGSQPKKKTIVQLDLEHGQRNTELGLLQPDTPALAAHLHNLSLQPMTSLAPWPNITTQAFYEGRFRSGYRNQMMAFTILVFVTLRQGHGQLLLTSLAQKDTYGSYRFIPFQKLWDVPHWNSHYPTLPRLVEHDPFLHDQYNLRANPPWFRNDTQFQNADGSLLTNKPVRPHAFGKQHQLMAGYIAYAKGNGINAAEGGHRNPIEILMLQGALRPHPNLQAIINEKLQQMLGVAYTTTTTEPQDYLTLHARVEPDMQRHVMCREKKVLNLTDIFDFIQAKWSDPPVSKIFLPINRQYLEEEGLLDNAHPKKRVNWIAVENLKALNWARDFGLWNGRVKVYEFGANSLVGTVYEKKPSTPGAMLNFFIGIQAKIFIGTEVSSYSHDLLATRFFRGLKENYKYLPQGLVDWTPEHVTTPPGFNC